MGDCSKTSSSDLTVVMANARQLGRRYSTKNYFVVDPIFQEDAPYFKDDVSVISQSQEDADQCRLSPTPAGCGKAQAGQ